MNEKGRSTESGQAIVLIVLSIVVLLGFTALAIDGGMFYADRRYTQNAADAASLAGGAAAAVYIENHVISPGQEWDCNHVVVINAQDNISEGAKYAAIARAGSNGFEIDAIAGEHGVSTQCDDTGGTLNYIDVITSITSTTKTSFAHFVYGGKLVNKVDAISRVFPPLPFADSHALVALNETCKADPGGNANDGLIFGGTGSTEVIGGGIFSYGCITCGGDFEVHAEEDISYIKDTTGCDTEAMIPTPQSAGSTIPSMFLNMPIPDCSHISLPDKGGHSGAGTISPGVYTNITLPNGTLNLLPGLYCITGSPDAFKITGGTIKSAELGESAGVTIYIESGDVSISANSDITLKAPEDTPDPSPAIPGLLFYVDGGSITVNGNAETLMIGTVYAPEGDILFDGGGDTTNFNTQLVGKNVKVTGNATVTLNSNNYFNYTIAASLRLQK